MSLIQVREYSLLTTVSVDPAPHRSSVKDQAQISESAFAWLLDQQGRFNKRGVPLVQIEGRNALRLDSFVGVLKTPCGTTIEILPKTQDVIPNEADVIKLRKLLIDMIRVSLHLPKRDMGTANLLLMKYPLSEWLIHEYLLMLDELIRKGLRFDYVRVDEENRFLRGQLNVSQQIQQPPGREHLFQIRHDIYTSERPENRLLKTALEVCSRISVSPENWKLASKLKHYLEDIPKSKNINQDLKAWDEGRLMLTYKEIRPWCELIIQRLNPTTQLGVHAGVSLLFPMERLFEDYVAKMLQQQFSSSKLSTQVQNRYLCVHKDKNWFKLKPDLCLQLGEVPIIMDTKWKLLDSSRDSKGQKYNLKESDYYQLFAYGHKYQNGTGDLILIYPKHDKFLSPLPMFSLGENLNLWVLPFDLESKRLDVIGVFNN